MLWNSGASLVSWICLVHCPYIEKYNFKLLGRGLAPNVRAHSCTNTSLICPLYLFCILAFGETIHCPWFILVASKNARMNNTHFSKIWGFWLQNWGGKKKGTKRTSKEMGYSLSRHLRFFLCTTMGLSVPA